MATEPQDSKGSWQRRPVRWFLRNWLERHQHPFNFWIHLVGIPLALGSLVAVFVLPWDYWYWPTATFLVGYLLQYIGHCVEGNDVGEFIPFKKMLGLPVIDIVPKRQGEAEPEHSLPGPSEPK
ncbi:MAG: Mpo1-like protein [Gemmataceae bacterium]